MTVSAVTNRQSPQAFSRDEEEALRRDAAPSDVLAEARRAKGDKGDKIALRGDDKTLAQEQEYQKSHVGVGGTVELGAAALHGLEMVGLHILRVPPKALAVVGAAAAAAAIPLGLAHLSDKKAALQNAAVRDVLHGAMTLKLDLPDAFKGAEMKRLGVSAARQDPAQKIADQITDKQRLQLQLHCDRGMNAARDAIAAGKDKQAMLKASPEAAKKYADDPAFKAGVDAMFWAKATSPEAFTQLSSALESRDARYAQAHVAFRG
jgi:hypothetical protein